MGNGENGKDGERKWEILRMGYSRESTKEWDRKDDGESDRGRKIDNLGEKKANLLKVLTTDCSACS